MSGTKGGEKLILQMYNISHFYLNYLFYTKQ